MLAEPITGNLTFGNKDVISFLKDMDSVAASALTDGSDDKKCDLIYVSRDIGAVIVEQGYESADTGRAEAKATKAQDLNTAAGWLLSRNLDDLPVRIRDAAEEVRDAIKSGDIASIQFWYVHNLPESQNVETELKTFEQTVQSAVALRFPEAEIEHISALEVGRGRLREWYEALNSPILVTDPLEVSVPGGYSLAGADWDAFVTAVPGHWLQELHKTYKSRLFSANVRDYLGSRASARNINHGIQETAKDAPTHFWVYNNGITALVHSYEHEKAKGKLQLSGLSIVNGKQQERWGHSGKTLRPMPWYRRDLCDVLTREQLAVSFNTTIVRTTFVLQTSEVMTRLNAVSGRNLILFLG